MGQNAASLHDESGEGLDDEIVTVFEGLFRDVGPRRRPPRGPKPETYFLRSIELAPDWPAPARELFRQHLGDDRAGEAERVARGLLARRPDDLPVLEGLAALLQRRGRAAEALALWKRALATNPLDRRLRGLAAHGYLAAARQNLIEERPAEALTLLDEGRAVCEVEFAVGLHSVRSVAARKLGRLDEAEAEQRTALTIPGGRLAAALYLSADSGMAKLKPADKKEADKRLASAVVEPPTPLEVNLLYGAWDSYHLAGIEYRGQKTQEKKIFALVEKCLDADAPEQDFENLCRGLSIRERWKLAEGAAAACERRFPTNPFFKVALAEAMHARNPRSHHERRIVRLLDEARSMITTSGDRHAGLIDRIDRLSQQYAGPLDVLEFMFGRRR
jgi:tetratricopeptide (TPR) repeat protein